MGARAWEFDRFRRTDCEKNRTAEEMANGEAGSQNQYERYSPSAGALNEQQDSGGRRRSAVLAGFDMAPVMAGSSPSWTVGMAITILVASSERRRL
jgi:hypothetical protein